MRSYESKFVCHEALRYARKNIANRKGGGKCSLELVCFVFNKRKPRKMKKISRQQLSCYENRIYLPRRRTLKVLAAIYQVPMEFFFREEENKALTVKQLEERKQKYNVDRVFLEKF